MTFFADGQSLCENAPIMKRLILLLLILLAFGLRVHQLDAFSFWQDEGLTPLRANLSIGQILSNEVTIQEGVSQDTHPPFYFLLMHFSRQLLGESDFGYRFPSVIAGVLLVPVLYQFGRSIGGTKPGLIAALLAAVNPMFIWYSQEARMYTLLILLVSIASYALWRALTGAILIRWLAVYLLFAGLAFLTHYTAAFLIAFQAIFWGYLLWRRGQRRLFIISAVLGLIILIPFIPYTIPRLFTGAETNYFYVSPLIMLQDVVHGFGMGLTAQFSQLRIKLLDLYMAVILILGLITSYKLSKTRFSSGWLLPMFLLVYLLAIVIGLAAGSLIKPMYQGIRHTIAGSSAFILLLSLGILGVPRRPRWLAFAALALLLLGPMISFNNLYNNGRFAKDDVRSLISYVEDRAGDRDLILYNNAIILASHWHYQERTDLPVTALPVYPHPADSRAISALEELSVEYERIWFINDPPADGRDDDGLVQSWLADHSLLIDREKFHGRTMKVEVDAYSTLPWRVSSMPPEAQSVSSANDFVHQLRGWGGSFSQPAALPTLWLDLYWALEEVVDGDIQLRFLLRDADDKVWLDHSQSFWSRELNRETGSSLTRLSYGLDLPAGLPAGDYSLQLIPWDKQSGEAIGEGIDLGMLALDSSQRWPSGNDIAYDTSGQIHFDNGYQLLGLTNTSAQARPGHTIPVFLFWASDSYDPQAKYRLELLGPDDELWDQHSSTPGPDWITGWETDAQMREIIGLQFPADAPPGKYRLRWQMSDGQEVVPGKPSWRPWSTDWINFGSIELHPWPLIKEIPEVEHLAKAQLGDDILLHGFDLPVTAFSPGDTLELTLYWQALNNPSDDFFAFVHLISPEDGAIVSQIDRIPADWLRPTSGWRADEYIIDSYQMALPEDLSPGTFLLYTGLFDPLTLVRPPVVVEEEAQPENRFELLKIDIIP